MATLYARINPDGRVAEWTSSERAAPWVQIETDADPLAIYLRDGEVRPLPPAPGDWAAFDPEAGAWNDPRSPAERLDAARADAWLAIPPFLVACVGAGIMTAEDAVAAQNGEIPPTFEALAGEWTLLQRLEARQWWKDRITANRVDRIDPFLAQVATDIEVSDPALDALFGITEE